MPNKLQAYAEQAERTARQITGSHLAWTAFLTTAARLYKYPYNEQLMIYMQRPEATACAEYDFWNEKMGRYVRRGSTGIALIDATGYKPRLKYVFDVSDTGGKENARRVNLWAVSYTHLDVYKRQASHRRMGIPLAAGGARRAVPGRVHDRHCGYAHGAGKNLQGHLRRGGAVPLRP